MSDGYQKSKSELATLSHAELVQERKRAQEIREEILEASTDSKLERNRQYVSELMAMEHEITRKALTLAASRVSEEEKALQSKSRDLKQREKMIIADAGGIVPDRYIRPDALAHFESEIKQLRKRVNKREPKESHHQAGPRLREMQNDLAEAESAWGQTQKLCKVGQKVFALRKEARDVAARHKQLVDAKQQNALAEVSA